MRQICGKTASRAGIVRGGLIKIAPIKIAPIRIATIAETVPSVTGVRSGPGAAIVLIATPSCVPNT